MKNVKVIFNDKKEIVADSYMLDKIDGHLVLRFFNPDSWEEIVDFVDACDQSRISLLINFPNREKRIDLDNYYMEINNTTNVKTGSILELHFKRLTFNVREVR